MQFVMVWRSSIMNCAMLKVADGIVEGLGQVGSVEV